jgi:hypothetical protein
LPAVSLVLALVACADTADRLADSTTARTVVDSPTTVTVLDSAVPRRVIDSTTTRRAVESNEPLASPESPNQLRLVCRAAAAHGNPKVRWRSDIALSADMTYDGKPEIVVWGNEGDSVFVLSIVECSGTRPGQVWSMPLDALKMFGSRDLDLAFENPSLGEGYLSENCMGAEKTVECLHLYKIDRELEAAYSRGGRGLSVGVEDRDHVHIYWDPGQARFVSWRP